MSAALRPGVDRSIALSVSPPITPYSGERPAGRPGGRNVRSFPTSESPPPAGPAPHQPLHRTSPPVPPSGARDSPQQAGRPARRGTPESPELDEAEPLDRSVSRKNPLESRLQRKVEAQSFSPAQASIVAAAQGLSEESLLVIADLVTYVCKKLGGRASQGQRRGANCMSEGAQTVDYVSEWVELQNEVLGINMLPVEYDRYCHSQWTPAQHQRRSSSCPQPKGRREDNLASSSDLKKGSRVAAAKDIKAKKVVVVSFGTEGVVNYVENGRVNVTFDERCDGSEKPINLKEECLTLLEQPDFLFEGFKGFDEGSPERGSS
eukprot:TRINITY_DN33158_c0_g1_i1.p1 TRINITY_DN33158_c0_g1~~TRINITY_DN33158_c0_g1_i1.p1  ORF type:complete len:320 (+),score=72.76 TRINITY_DN33158_c0_g1_i1:78-1037(+)